MELFDDNSPQKQNFGVRADSSNTVLDENDLRLIRRFHVLLHKKVVRPFDRFPPEVMNC